MIKNLIAKECIEILSNNYIGRLAYIAEGQPLVVPITYYYDQPNNRIISYSTEGLKIESMRKNGIVSLEVDEIISVNRWRSVLALGLFEELSSIDAKHQLHQFAQGVKNTIASKEKGNPQFIGEFSSKLKAEGIPIVYRLAINKITGKQRNW
jgi:nitroimidazol reductase NimA-like FMN-containing flavoprotein (pyridoxamine 5'-phosphate oxidase superfamily)